MQFIDPAYTTLGWYTVSAPIDWTNPVCSGGLDLDATAPYQDLYRSEETKAIYAQQRFIFSERLIAIPSVANSSSLASIISPPRSMT